jgi:hypothetical protein
LLALWKEKWRMPLGKPMRINKMYGISDITVRNVILKGDLTCLPIRNYDVVLGMGRYSVSMSGRLGTFGAICMSWEEKTKEDRYMISGVTARMLLHRSHLNLEKLGKYLWLIVIEESFQLS